MSADETEADNMCCASCGIAELDDIKLKDCDVAISLDIVAMSAKKNIGVSMTQNVKNGRLNYGMRFYLGSLRAAISATVRFAVCRCHLIIRIPYHISAAAK
eukprot:scaffold33524_cov99-Skeletonema_dohrnii-CCMP3373.AAC.5